MGFQIFLAQLAEKYPDNLNVIPEDNGKFHHNSRLKITSGYFTYFSTTIQPRIESNGESVVAHKTRTELGNLGKFRLCSRKSWRFY
jgi:hypothetical protein